MTAQPAEPTAFDAVLALLAAAGIHSKADSEGKVAGSYGVYEFADGGQLTWGTQSNTGAENSITHPVSAHGRLGGFYIDDERDETREFTTGDFNTDAAAFVAWVSDLANRHGRPSE
ncbi:hypothetical protein ACIHJG_34225 [Streptomyces sp. NPDC052415]|uniref:hypothetical protein n=1 Tax=Streptomyces sp. NPDC052415 TaxID=3365690 RepID=UPI0037CD7758